MANIADNVALLITKVDALDAKVTALEVGGADITPVLDAVADVKAQLVTTETPTGTP